MQNIAPDDAARIIDRTRQDSHFDSINICMPYVQLIKQGAGPIYGVDGHLFIPSFMLEHACIRWLCESSWSAFGHFCFSSILSARTSTINSMLMDPISRAGQVDAGRMRKQ